MSVVAYGGNNYKGSNTTYSFKINIINNLQSTGRIYVNFTSDWNLYSKNCTINSGIVPKPNGTNIYILFILIFFLIKLIYSKEQISCWLVLGRYSYVIENF